jgi:glutamine---fructose-6-phosphate transaminase (isomerizing)
MRAAIWAQPAELRRLLADPEPPRAAAGKLRGRPVRLVGIGTSWHAAHHGAWLLAEACVDARAEHAADLAPYGRGSADGEAVIVLGHTGYSEARGTNPDRFRYDEDPGRERAFESIGF